jgi:hypothetical protein
MPSAAERQLDFLRKLQRLLDEGDFSSTCKSALLQALAASHLAHDRERCEFIASWAYEQAERAGAHAWIAGREVARIGSAWRQALHPLPAVAESTPRYLPAS